MTKYFNTQGTQTFVNKLKFGNSALKTNAKTLVGAINELKIMIDNLPQPGPNVNKVAGYPINEVVKPTGASYDPSSNAIYYNYAPDIVADDGNFIYLSNNNNTYHKRSNIILQRSTDNGNTKNDIATFTDDSKYANKLIKLPNGTIVSVSNYYYRLNQPEQDTSTWRYFTDAKSVASSDNGVTWSSYAIDLTDIIEVGTKLFGIKENRQEIVVSTDNGETWSTAYTIDSAMYKYINSVNVIDNVLQLYMISYPTYSTSQGDSELHSFNNTSNILYVDTDTYQLIGNSYNMVSTGCISYNGTFYYLRSSYLYHDNVQGCAASSIIGVANGRLFLKNNTTVKYTTDGVTSTELNIPTDSDFTYTQSGTGTSTSYDSIKWIGIINNKLVCIRTLKVYILSDDSTTFSSYDIFDNNSIFAIGFKSTSYIKWKHYDSEYGDYLYSAGTLKANLANTKTMNYYMNSARANSGSIFKLRVLRIQNKLIICNSVNTISGAGINECLLFGFRYSTDGGVTWKNGGDPDKVYLDTTEYNDHIYCKTIDKVVNYDTSADTVIARADTQQEWQDIISLNDSHSYTSTAGDYVINI